MKPDDIVFLYVHNVSLLCNLLRLVVRVLDGSTDYRDNSVPRRSSLQYFRNQYLRPRIHSLLERASSRKSLWPIRLIVLKKMPISVEVARTAPSHSNLICTHTQQPVAPSTNETVEMNCPPPILIVTLDYLQLKRKRKMKTRHTLLRAIFLLD